MLVSWLPFTREYRGLVAGSRYRSTVVTAQRKRAGQSESYHDNVSKWNVKDLKFSSKVLKIFNPCYLAAMVGWSTAEAVTALFVWLFR